MENHPNPDFKVTKTLKSLIVSAFLSLIVAPIMAVETHHFEIGCPETVFVNQEAQFNITAHQKDGSLVTDAHHRVTVVFSNPDETITENLEILNGKGTLNTVFHKTSFYLIDVRDDDNSSLARSGSIRVVKGKVVLP